MHCLTESLGVRIVNSEHFLAVKRIIFCKRRTLCSWIVDECPVLLLCREIMLLDTVDVVDGHKRVLLLLESHQVGLLYVLEEA